MQITIDNEDGLGPANYTAAISQDGPITLQRMLNAPSRCTAEIVSEVAGLAVPSRRGRVVVTDDAGLILFTGYLATEPVATYAGVGATGPAYRARFTAVSDEWLLDRQGSGASSVNDGLSVGLDSGGLVSQLTQAAQTADGVVNTGFTLTTGENLRASGAFAVQPSAGWSTNAAVAANATYASYRVLNGAVSVSSAGTVTHTFSEADGTLDVAELSTSHVRELANDVTISGEEEPAAYMQEIFLGDGTTADFVLSRPAFRGTNRTLLRDSFGQAAIDVTQWTLSDGGSHLQLGAEGLVLNGGNGFDGQTTLVANRAVEMSGCLVTQLSGTVFQAASDGMLAGFYDGTLGTGDCLVGFRVRQSASTTGGMTVVVPVVNGVECGTVFTPVSGHSYTMRLRLFCVEMQRVPQRYYCMVDGVVQEFGETGGVSAPLHAVFEMVDEGVSSNTPATVLYDTVEASAPIPVTPATCTFAAVNSASLFGSVGAIALTRTGSLSVVSTLPNGTQSSRLTGAVGQAGDCAVQYGSAGTPGKITFFPGRIPVVDERVTVQYRTQRRAVARCADKNSIAAESAAGTGFQIPGVSRWLGKVTAPVARSSADCEAAAQAVLAMATARSAAVAGTYRLINPAQDIWPGDVLQITSGGMPHSLLVRSVTVEDCHAVPEVLRYKVEFANDWATEWADGLGLKLSDSVSSDAALPATAASGPGVVLDNLQQMSVVSLTGSAIQIDAGMNAPAGGGFEVRRRDWAFGVGVDRADLVLRSPVKSFSIPRSAQVEQFFVRMYDGSTPPVYSRYSSALVVNWPLS